MCGSGDKEDNLVRYETDDLIYNRFDLIYTDNVERYFCELENKKYFIDVHYENYKAVLNVWGKEFPQDFFDNTIEEIFRRHFNLCYIEIKRAGNNYKNLLDRCNDIHVSIPVSKEELLQRLKKKHRYTLKRIKRLFEEEYGKLETVIYKECIPDEMVNQYFTWKQLTHGTDYHMSPKEYLIKYHVTDGMLLKAGDNNIAILFFCQVNNTVYLENFSYNVHMEKNSPGFLIYEMFLEELICRKCTNLYVGGGEYEYKKRFGAEENIAYSGIIYRKEVFEVLNEYFERQSIKKIAIYGLGTMGHIFLRIVNFLNVDLEYGIDKKEKQIENLQVYFPWDNLKEVDAVIITLKFHNKEVEEVLKQKFKKIYYWSDIVEEYLRTV